ncbi:Isochorismatase domain-containing protein 1 [Galdieria sulphuraria]|uniref:Ribonuclease n=1 Tax=Galdieria sulphuraria TaxID=130081 RepID=M2Y7Y6_GALSU|nr:ribonuclease [Galdieria sulphuraria]EME32188.1 ribonuclease [Galdieria sulphuraria]GJD09612.1 Isochorismatase domain-containing protein 1 [Galdieria sulphuraria]|eukprot:XP_005708708.1 ribonuclease [Galdieria sulphuraria]
MKRLSLLLKEWKNIIIYGDGKTSQYIRTGAEKQACVLANRLEQSLQRKQETKVEQYFQRVYPHQLWKRWFTKAIAKLFLKTIAKLKPQSRMLLSDYFLRISKHIGCFESPIEKLDNTNNSHFSLEDPFVLVGAASSTAPFLVAMRYRYKSCKTIQVLHPRCNTDLFDAVVSPKHDSVYQKFNKDNWIPTTLSLHELTPEYLKQIRETTIRQYPVLASVIKVVILIGGPRNHWQLIYCNPYKSIARFMHYLSQAVDRFSQQNYIFLVTVSNRTPSKVSRLLYQQLQKNFLKDNIWFYDPKQPNSQNPYHQYLSVADYILVTSESVNMISEALSCQRPVYVYDLFGTESTRFSGRRLRLFLNNLVQRGWIARFEGTLHVHSLHHSSFDEKNKCHDCIEEEIFTTLLSLLEEIPECILLVCDIQERFRSVIYQYTSVINAAKILLEAAELFKIPVIATEQYPRALGHTVEELDSQKMKVYEKTVFSMMVPEVEKCLLEHSLRRTAVIVGIETHVCVLQTTLDLLEKGYSVHIVTDGVSSQRAMDRSTAFRRLEQAGAWLTTYESLLFQLLRSKDHPSFKQVSELCKRPRPDPGLNTL